MSIAKKNHYVSQFYLKEFTNNDNKFYQYNKINKKFEPDTPLTPKGVCWIRDFYVLKIGVIKKDLTINNY